MRRAGILSELMAGSQPQPSAFRFGIPALGVPFLGEAQGEERRQSATPRPVLPTDQGMGGGPE